MMEMIEEGIYTTGNSFRAEAEAKARRYRFNVLHLSNYGEYGHILSDIDGEKGMNFLPSLREKIFSEVIKRDQRGKGVDIERTTKNMLSSQAMCFNLFAPLNLHKNFASAFFRLLLGDFAEFTQDIDYEYTPSKSIFNDQSGKGGVDCDALLKYKNIHGKNSLLVIETKFVEKEFSSCGFRKKTQKDPCPRSTVVNPDFSNCRYHYKKYYNYWKVAKESDLFNMEYIQSIPCPFGSSLWQLWTNMSLAYAIAKEQAFDDFSYAVICPDKNDKLSNHEKKFNEFRKLLKNPSRFKVIYLSDIRKTFEKIEQDFPYVQWSKEFINRYCF